MKGSKYRTMAEKLAHERKVRKTVTAALVTLILCCTIAAPIAVNKVRQMLDDSRRVILVRDAFWLGQDDYLRWLLENGMMPKIEAEEADEVDTVLKDKTGRTSGGFGDPIVTDGTVKDSAYTVGNTSYTKVEHDSEKKGSYEEPSKESQQEVVEDSKNDESFHALRQNTAKFVAEGESGYFEINNKDVQHVYVDGVEVNFNIKNGKLYLNIESIENGSHTARIVWAEGNEKEVNFTVSKVVIAAADGQDNQQDTGNDNQQDTGNDNQQSTGNDNQQDAGNDNQQTTGNDNQQNTGENNDHKAEEHIDIPQSNGSLWKKKRL